MLIPLYVDVPMNRLPIANWVLMAVITGVSIVGWMSQDVFLFLAGYVWPGGGLMVLLAQPVFDLGWMLPIVAVTTTFLHGDLIHLGANLLFLWIFGNAVNYKLGHLGFLGVYFGGALVASLAQYIAVPGVGGIGASGAVMCVMGVFLVFFPRNDVKVILVPPLTVLWPEPIYVSSWVPMLLWIGLNALFLWLGDEDVGYVAHLTGFALGFVVGLLLALKGIVEPTRYEETLLQALGIHEMTR